MSMIAIFSGAAPASKQRPRLVEGIFMSHLRAAADPTIPIAADKFMRSPSIATFCVSIHSRARLTAMSALFLMVGRQHLDGPAKHRSAVILHRHLDGEDGTRAGKCRRRRQTCR